MLYVKHSLHREDAVVLVAVYFIWLKLALIVALALMFSCFTTPLLAILFTAGLYIVGLYVQELRNLPVEVMSPAMAAFTKWLSYLLPNFENFQCDGDGGARAGRAGDADSAEHALCGDFTARSC